MSVTRSSLLRLLGRHTRRTSKGWYNFCHKRCGDRRFRLGVNFGSRRFRCFNCGLNGDLDALVPGLNDADLTLLVDPPKPKAPPPTDLPWRPIQAEGPVRVLEKDAVSYLASRGVPRSHAARLGLGYGLDGCWLGRVIHPYYDARGTLAGWQGRLTYDPEPGEARKIRFATQRDLPARFRFLSPAEGAVYMIERVKPGTPLLLVEGPYDAIHAERAIQAVALFGSNLTEAQAARILSKKPIAIYLGLDRDKSGRRWNKDAKRWEPDPRPAMARLLYTRTGGQTPIYVVEYPNDFEGDWGGYEDKTPHTREELLVLLSGAVRWRPGVRLRGS